jgi:hypothetical protein
MLSWMIGPPNAKPYSFDSEGVVMSAAFSPGVRARQLSCVYVPKAWPSNVFVPERVTAVMAALEIWSYSAL